MKILVPIDIEEEMRSALAEYMTVYVRPLPETLTTPCIEITSVGGTEEQGRLGVFDVTLDARAEEDAEANEYIRHAIGYIRAIAESQETAMRHIRVNTIGTWGNDPVRPDLAMYSARIRVWTHLETIETED